MKGLLQVLSSKTVLLALMIGSMLGASANIALAGTVSSPYYYYGPVLGYYYENQSQVMSYGNIQGVTYVALQNDGQIPAGYVGAQANLFNSSDALCEASAWNYDDSAGDVGYSVLTPYGGACGSGNYYSLGESASYNGNGYTDAGTYQSPNYTY